MIDFNNIEVNFADKTILDSVCFRINSSERVGLVGPNGAGKSTIFNIVTGDLTPSKGEVVIPKRMRIGYLKQQLANTDLTTSLLDYTADAIAELTTIAAEIDAIEALLADNNSDTTTRESALNRMGHLQTEFEHLGGYRLRPEAEAALCSLGFAPEALQKPLSSFSGGWQMRAALAKTLISDPDILLLDEPSNYLDIPAVEWLCKFLRSFQGTLLLISHDRFLLDKLTNVTLELNAGQVTRYNGNYSYYRIERESRKLALDAAQKNIDKKRKDLERNIDRFRAKSSKAAQAQAWVKQLEKINDVNVIADDLSYRGAIRFPEPPPCGTEAVRFEDVDFGYTPERKVIQNGNLQIDCGEKAAFIGFNGMGKSTLLKLITGNLTPQKGVVVLGHNIIVGYQAQEFADLLPPEMSVFDVVRAACSREFPVATLPSVIGSFGFSGSDQNKLCKVLSGGEKIRLCFCRIFVNPPNLLILDEPTTHLDIAAREMLQKMLKSYKGTVCFVSHDIEFVRGAAGLIFAVRPDGVRKYYGNYDYYLEKVAQEQQLESSEKGSIVEQRKSVENVDSKERRRERAKLRQQSAPKRKKLEKEVADLERSLEEHEERKGLIIEEMSNNSSIDFAAKNRELATLDSEIDRITQEWEQATNALLEMMDSD